MAFDVSKFMSGLDDAARKRVEPALVSAVNKVAQHTVGQAQKLAPISQPNQYIPGKRKNKIKNPRWTGHMGALKASGVAMPAEIVGTKIIAVLGFNTEYAAAVHERLDQHHDQGQAKYLSVPIQKNQALFPQTVAAEIKKVL